MPTQSSSSRHWSIKTSGNDAEVIVPAEPTEADIQLLEALFAEVRQKLRKRESCRHPHTAQLGGSWFQCVDCGVTFEG